LISGRTSRCRTSCTSWCPASTRTRWSGGRSFKRNVSWDRFNKTPFFQPNWVGIDVTKLHFFSRIELGLIQQNSTFSAELSWHRFNKTQFLAENVSNYVLCIRVTRWVYEKIAQNVANPIFCQDQFITLTVEISSLKMWATFLIFINLPKVNSHHMRRPIWSPCFSSSIFWQIAIQ
jgi:hypothetical protein